MNEYFIYLKMKKYSNITRVYVCICKEVNNEVGR